MRAKERGQGMDGSGKIALGIVAAAALLLLGFVADREFERQRDIAEAQAMLQGLADTAQQAVQDGQREAAQRQRWRVEQQQRALDARRLGQDERCVGGTVVVVSGSSYTQVAGAGGRPTACSGRFRL
jgi:hypothetical protein